MYICVCNAIREKTLRDAARKCAQPAEQIYERLGCKAQCGQCLEDADYVIADEMARTPA